MPNQPSLLAKALTRPGVPCTATTTGGKTGEAGRPCKNFAIHGGTVCPFHGGKAPHVKEAAKQRLLELVVYALEVLARSMEFSPMPDRAAFDTDKQYAAALAVWDRNRVPPAVALKAATEVLDRAGIDLENKAGAREITVKFVRPEVAE